MIWGRNTNRNHVNYEAGHFIKNNECLDLVSSLGLGKCGTISCRRPFPPPPVCIAMPCYGWWCIHWTLYSGHKSLCIWVFLKLCICALYCCEWWWCARVVVVVHSLNSPLRATEHSRGFADRRAAPNNMLLHALNTARCSAFPIPPHISAVSERNSSWSA